MNYRKIARLLLYLLPLAGFSKQMPAEMLNDIRRARAMGCEVTYDEDKLDIAAVADTLHAVLETMEDFPKEFFRKGGLRRLHFKAQMTSIDGKFTAGGFGGGNTMTLPVGGGVSRYVIAHEMYHVFDNRSSEDAAWGKFNHRDFIYKQQRAEMNFNYTEKEQKRFLKKLANSPKKSHNYQIERALGKKAVKQIAENDANPEIQKGFVSGYAQTNQREDRAETFASMYCEQEAFLTRVENSPVLKKKMKFIQEETKNWLGHRYWQQVTEYGNDPKYLILSSPMPSDYSNAYQRVTIPRTILNDDILVKYKDLKGKIRPGQPVERIMKRLRADIERAKDAPESEYFTERKKEALRIAKNVKVYKTALINCANKLRECGDRQGVEKTVRLMIETWPGQADRWREMFNIDLDSM